MKTSAAIILSAALLITGCNSASLVGREYPPGQGPPDGGAADSGSPTVTPVGKGDDAPPPPPPVDSGSPGGAVDAVDVPPLVLGPPPGVDPAFTIPDSLVGEWTGYLEAFQLTSGSDTLALRLIRTAGQADRIEVVLGVGPATGPIGTDPWVASPTIGVLGPRPLYAEGFPYPAHQVSWTGNRLVFRISLNEAWQNWCAARTSYSADSTTDHTCASDTDYNQSFDDCLRPSKLAQTVPAGCVATWACRSESLCACDATHCAATFALDGTVDVTFDAPVTGALNIGSYAAFRLNRAGITDGGASDAQ
ncbi:MAG TPA: hypothetical protein VGL59_01570 [Polyangia bacterium]|jgi:hypothetical protein